MKIDSLSGNRSTTLRRSGGASPGKPGAFAQALSEDAPNAAPVAGGTGAGPVQALLALQEIPDPLMRRKQAQQRGEDLLDQLDELRMALLTGTLPRGAVERLATVAAATRERSDDPRLEGILAEIELRVAVELAKLDG